MKTTNRQRLTRRRGGGGGVDVGDGRAASGVDVVNIRPLATTMMKTITLTQIPLTRKPLPTRLRRPEAAALTPRWRPACVEVLVDVAERGGGGGDPRADGRWVARREEGGGEGGEAVAAAESSPPAIPPSVKYRTTCNLGRVEHATGEPILLTRSLGAMSGSRGRRAVPAPSKQNASLRYM